MALALGLIPVACRAAGVEPGEPAAPGDGAAAEPATPGEPAEPTPPDLWPSVIDRPWSLFRLDGGPALGQRAGIELQSGGALRGHGGVNWLTGEWTRSGAGGLGFGPIAATRMASGDWALSGQEHRFLRALDRVDGWRMEGERLALTQSGRTILLFVQRSFPR